MKKCIYRRLALALAILLFAFSIAHAASVTLRISAENNFTSPIAIQGYFNFSLSGTWVGTVTIQRSFDRSNWMDVKTYTSNKEDSGYEPESGVYYRAGIKSGEFTSGSAVVRLSK